MKQLIKPLFIALALLTGACKKFVEIDPPTDQIVSEKVYSNDEMATSAIRGIYAQMMSSSGFASGNINSITLLAGRSADDFTNFNIGINYVQFATNTLSPDNTALRGGLWQEPYKYIYNANLVLENLQQSNQVSTALKQQLEGEAKFIRAFCHFYLTNLFGQVPLILTTDYRINALAFASSKEQIYTQIIKDLTEAKSLLSDNYPSTERIRPNKWAATALLARVYLFHQEWANAESQSTEVITHNNTYSLPDDLNQVFLTNSPETILQFVAPTSENTYEGKIFILTTAPGSTTNVVLSNSLFNAFELGDQRLEKWVGTYSNASTSWHFPSKYKKNAGSNPYVEYTMILRLGEQFLIRAEARAMQNNFEGGRLDLNKIRDRAGLGDVNYNTQAELLLAIERERRVEFFAEWGHRWLDLKRTNRANAVLGPLKSPNWQGTDVLYPIPRTEIVNDPNLIQNDGYN